MNKVLVAGPSVVVILRHDPANSDPVDVAQVILPSVLGTTEDDDKLLEKAEAWAQDREIEWLKDQASEPADDPDERRLQLEQLDFVKTLTRANLAKKTDIWFEPILMPMIVEELRDA